MKKLYELDPAEVSLVDKGANRKKFLVFKSKGNNMQPSKEIMALVNSVSPQVIARVEKVVKAVDAGMSPGDLPPKPDSRVYKNPHGMMKEGNMPPEKNEQAGEVAPMSDRAMAAMKASARILAPHKDEIHDGHMDAMQKEIGMKENPMHEAAGHEEHQGEDMLEKDMMEKSKAEPHDVEEEHHAAALEMAKKAYKAHLEKMGYRKHEDEQPKVGSDGIHKDKHGDDEDDEEDGVEKSKVSKSAPDLSAFPKEQRAQLEGIFKANVELVQKNETLEKELKHERDIRVRKEFEEKVAGFKHIGADKAKLAKIMKSMSEKSPEELKEFEAILKAMDNQAAQAGLFTEIGTKRGEHGGTEADVKLRALVDSVVQKSDGNMSRAQVADAVYQTPEGKRLLAESIAQSQKGGR